MIEKTEGLLAEGEEVINDARIHEIVFAPPIIYTIIGILAGLFYHPTMGIVILLMTLYPVYTAIVHYQMTHLTLTNKKVMARVGFLSRDWVQMAFERIENAHLEEPILGRYLGYSTVIVGGVGTGSIAIPYVINGDKFTKQLTEFLDENRQEYKPEKNSTKSMELTKAA